MRIIILSLLCAMLILAPAQGLLAQDQTTGSGAIYRQEPGAFEPTVLIPNPLLKDEDQERIAPMDGQTRAEDWPMFIHDVSHTGNTSSRIPTTNESLWTYDTAQMIQSSAAIVGGVVYFGSNDNNVYALWANNGTLKWKFNNNNDLDDIPNSPAVVNGKVYVSVMNKGVYCLWASNGTKLWNKTLAPANYRNYNSPLVVNDTVYIPNDLSGPSTIFALNATTGATKWSKTYSGYIVSSMAYKNGKVFVGRQQGGILCLWANNGTQIWYGLPSSAPVYSSPSVSENRVFFTSETGWIYALYLNNGTKAWEHQFGVQTYSSPALSNGKVFIGGSAYYQSNGTQIWSEGFSQYSTPAISGNRLVVLNDTKLTCQSTLDGTILWEVEVTGEYASPAVSENMVVIGGNDGTMYAFSTPDVTPPNVTSNLPAHQAAAVPVDANIVINFSELMEELVTRAAFSISPSVVGVTTWVDQTMTFNPTSQLSSETVYTVTVKGTAMDRSGNQLDGNKNGISGGSPQDDHVFNFTTVSVAPPTVSSVLPAKGALLVQPNSPIVVSFSQPMNQLITQGAFSLAPATIGSFAWNTNSTTMTFTPSAKLLDKKTYNCTVTHTALGQSGKILDGNKDGLLSNNALDDFLWNFTIIDWVPPQVVSVSPLDGAVDVPIRPQITIEFSEPMAASSTETALTSVPSINGDRSWNGTVLTIALSEDLAFDTDHTFTVGTLAQDLFGLKLDGDGDGIGGENNDDFTWSFRTLKPIIPPFIESVSPQANATDVLIDTTLSMTFSKAMNKALVESAVSVDGDLATSLGYSMSWDVQDRVLTLQPSVNLSYGSNHTVTVAATAASADGIGLDGDKDGASEGIGIDDYKWTFKTEAAPIPPLPLPKITDVRPLAGATGVPITTNIVVNFSLEMNRTSVVLGIIIDPQVQFTSSFDNDGKILTIDPINDLANNKIYKISISGGILSKAGASLDGDLDNISEGSPTDDKTWIFRTVSAPVVLKPPVIGISRPSNNDTIKGTFIINGTASDLDTPSADLLIEIMFDDSGLWTTVGKGATWTYSWDTTTVKDGPHKITVRAYDGKNYSPSVSCDVKIKNAKVSGLGLGLMTYLLIALVALIAAAVVAAALIMRRKKGGQPQYQAPQAVVPPVMAQQTPQPAPTQQPTFVEAQGPVTSQSAPVPEPAAVPPDVQAPPPLAPEEPQGPAQ